MRLNSLHYTKKSLWLPIALMLIIATMVPIITEAEINKSGVYFSVIPERNIGGANGTDFTVNITITNAPNTYAWEAYLGFDPSVVSVDDVDQGPWLAPEGNTTFIVKLRPNYVGISCTFKGAFGPASGSGRLCNVTFTVEDDTGFAKLNLYDTSLVDMDGKRSYYPNNDGFFEGVSVITLHDVAITKITVNGSETGIQVAQNDTVEVIVYILNEGDEDQTVGIKVYAERLTHNPADQDEVWVGDWVADGQPGSMDTLPNNVARGEYKIGENASVSVTLGGGTNSSRFTWDTTNVAGEVYKICAVLIKDGDNDPDDNEFVGPEVHVVSTHDLKVVDVEVLTPEVDKSNYVTPVGDVVVMNFTEVGAAYMTSIQPCKNYTANSMLQRQGPSTDMWAPLPSTWWHIIASGAASPYEWNSINFHVDWSNATTHEFHIDQVILQNGIPGVPAGGPAIWVFAEQAAEIKVTVKNEGTLPETAVVTVFANATTVGTHTVPSLAVNETVTLYFSWTLAAVPTGEYIIKASVANVTGEHSKNQLDNEFIDDTIEVVIYDASVLKVEVLNICNINGLHPIVRVRATVANNGTKLTRVTLYWIAIEVVPATYRQIVFGTSLGVTLKVDNPDTPEDEAVTIIDTCTPYYGWNTKVLGLRGEDKPTPGNYYWILALAVPSTGFRDDNPYDDPGYYKTLQLPDVDYDVTGYWSPAQPTIEIDRGWVYQNVTGIPSGLVLVNVSVVNYAQNTADPTQYNLVNVDLYYRDPSVTMNFTGDGGAPITVIANCTWFQVIGDPPAELQPCSWWYIILFGLPSGEEESPPSIHVIEFHVDEVDGNRFHVDDVMVSGNHTAADITRIMGTPAKNATAEIEKYIDSKVAGPLPPMEIMTFFNETYLTTGSDIVSIEPCKWYMYNLTLYGPDYFGNVKYPANDTWWDAVFPATSFPFYKFHIDTGYITPAPYGGWMYKFHVDKVIHTWSGQEKNVTGYPYPVTITMAWRLQPQTLSFALNVSDFDTSTPCTYCGVNLVARYTIIGYYNIYTHELVYELIDDDDPCDNKVTGYGIFYVRVMGDADNSGVVSWGDKTKLGIAWLKTVGQPGYDLNADFNYDGVVAWADKTQLGLNWLKGCP